ncbi:MAG TPA: trypsin-like peptidase domain-containing protein [Gemmatimonadales bacterium]|nr:trypsin-like peptidase domain-containing protein [Gemmatimonadales bacterium]
MKAQFKFLSGARSGQVETFQKTYLGLGRHPLSDVRFDAERDLDVSSRHAAIMAKPEGYVLQDLGSKNGTFVNGEKLTGDRLLVDGDVIGFGAKGPAVEFRTIAGPDDHLAETATAAEVAAGRLSNPKQIVPATVPPPTKRPGAPRARSTTSIIEMATAPWRRTASILVGMVVLVVALSLFVVWKGAQDRKAELARIRAWADSVAAQAQQTAQQFQTEIQGLHDANQQAVAEIERLRGQLNGAGSDANAVRSLRTQLQQAQARQQLIAGAGAVDYRTISSRNQDAVALVLVEFSETERFSGTAFAIDSQGTLVTNKHVLVGENGDKTPRRIAVKFSGSKQWFPGRYIGVSDAADVGVLKVDIRGGTPRVQGLNRDPRSLQRGDPVAIIGYPLGLDLPMEGQGTDVVASPTLTVGTASKVLPTVVQVDGYGAPGSSGSPIFDHDGRVVAVLYGGVQESNGKIILAVPVSFVTEYLNRGR